MAFERDSLSTFVYTCLSADRENRDTIGFIRRYELCSSDVTQKSVQTPMTGGGTLGFSRIIENPIAFVVSMKRLMFVQLIFALVRGRYYYVTRAKLYLMLSKR